MGSKKSSAAAPVAAAPPPKEVIITGNEAKRRTKYPAPAPTPDSGQKSGSTPEKTSSGLNIG